jgi:hypothetical protein
MDGLAWWKLFPFDAESDGRGSYEVKFAETVTQWLALKHSGSTQKQDLKLG